MIRIKELRTEKNKSLRDVAADLNISYSSLSKYERGDQQPSFETITKIADYFNVPIDYLLGHTNVKDLKHKAINDKLGLSDNAIHNLEKCNSLNYDVSTFIENEVFLKLMEAYTEYVLLLNLPDEPQIYEYGYDSFNMSDPFDILQKNFLDRLEDMPTKEAYQIYINSLFQKLLNTTK